VDVEKASMVEDDREFGLEISKPREDQNVGLVASVCGLAAVPLTAEEFASE
jgi:hypothetical protein